MSFCCYHPLTLLSSKSQRLQLHLQCQLLADVASVLSHFPIFSPWRNLEDTRSHVWKTSHSRWRFSRTQAVPFSGLEDPGSPSERIASSFTGTASRLTWRPCQVHREIEYTDIWWGAIAWTIFRVFCSTWNIPNSSFWIVLDVLRLKVTCCDPSLSLNGFHQSSDWATHSYHTYSRQWPMIPND